VTAQIFEIIESRIKEAEALVAELSLRSVATEAKTDVAIQTETPAFIKVKMKAGMGWNWLAKAINHKMVSVPEWKPIKPTDLEARMGSPRLYADKVYRFKAAELMGTGPLSGGKKPDKVREAAPSAAKSAVAHESSTPVDPDSSTPTLAAPTATPAAPTATPDSPPVSKVAPPTQKSRPKEKSRPKDSEDSDDGFNIFDPLGVFAVVGEAIDSALGAGDDWVNSLRQGPTDTFVDIHGVTLTTADVNKTVFGPAIRGTVHEEINMDLFAALSRAVKRPLSRPSVSLKGKTGVPLMKALKSYANNLAKGAKASAQLVDEIDELWGAAIQVAKEEGDLELVKAFEQHRKEYRECPAELPDLTAPEDLHATADSDTREPSNDEVRAAKNLKIEEPGTATATKKEESVDADVEDPSPQIELADDECLVGKRSPKAVKKANVCVKLYKFESASGLYLRGKYANGRSRYFKAATQSSPSKRVSSDTELSYYNEDANYTWTPISKVAWKVSERRDQYGKDWYSSKGPPVPKHR